MLKTLVVVPTYNEKDNIPNIIAEIFNLNPEVNILVVDDQSPDGTGLLVDKLIENEKRLFHLARTKKEGLGKAYIAGFNWGIENGYEVICEMDADFSHRPKDLKKLLEVINDKTKKVDFVVGSRYIPEGKTVNWSFFRKLISRGGGLYARTILGFPLNDWTGGFNIWRKEVLLGIDLKTIRSEGYSFQIELKYKGLKRGFNGIESPIVFEERREGQSKMSIRIVLEAIYKVWMIRFV